jgi:hypothetical protein
MDLYSIFRFVSSICVVLSCVLSKKEGMGYMLDLSTIQVVCEYVGDIVRPSDNSVE